MKFIVFCLVDEIEVKKKFFPVSFNWKKLWKGSLNRFRPQLESRETSFFQISGQYYQLSYEAIRWQRSKI